nr:MAG TPA: hypothetical protein [Caudoviricetes sp.]
MSENLLQLHNQLLNLHFYNSNNSNKKYNNT